MPKTPADLVREARYRDLCELLRRVDGSLLVDNAKAVLRRDLVAQITDFLQSVSLEQCSQLVRRFGDPR